MCADGVAGDGVDGASSSLGHTLTAISCYHVIYSGYIDRNNMIPIVFEDDIDLMNFADEFIVKDRLASLENDVNRCLPSAKIKALEYAPFPTLMYCFSIVDLLLPFMPGMQGEEMQQKCGKIHGKIHELS